MKKKKLFTAQAFSGPLNSKIFQKILILAFEANNSAVNTFHIFAQCVKCNRILYICIKVVSLHNLHVVLTYKRNNIFFLISDILILCVCYLFMIMVGEFSRCKGEKNNFYFVFTYVGKTLAAAIPRLT